MKMTPERWSATTDYLVDVFGDCDEHLSGLMDQAVAAGLPDIAVSADVGRLLGVLTAMTQGRLAVELGTLAGYSAIWIARALDPTGRLVTVEPVEEHADFAQRQFERAGVADRVELRRARGLEVLKDLREQLAPGSVDLLFFDAVKTEYPEYWTLGRELVRPGGLVVADNVLGTSSWWIDHDDHPERIAIDAFNRAVAGDPDFEAMAVPLREGLLIARRRDRR